MQFPGSNFHFNINHTKFFGICYYYFHFGGMYINRMKPMIRCSIIKSVSILKSSTNTR